MLRDRSWDDGKWWLTADTLDARTRGQLGRPSNARLIHLGMPPITVTTTILRSSPASLPTHLLAPEPLGHTEPRARSRLICRAFPIR